MQTKSQLIPAGLWTRLTTNGNFFMLLEALGAVSIEFESAGGGAETVEGVGEGFGVDSPYRLNSLRVYSAAAQTIKYVYGEGSAFYDRTTINAQSASALTDLPVVAIGTAPTLLIAAGARKGLAVRNTHIESLYICGPLGTTATAGYEIQPGDTWEVPVNLVCAELYGLFAGAAGNVAVMPGV
jgi:hypothetical protein